MKKLNLMIEDGGFICYTVANKYVNMKNIAD